MMLLYTLLVFHDDDKISGQQPKPETGKFY